MSTLKNFRHLDIDWDLSPEDAVTLYLEWGNNNWHAPFPPVRSKEDYATYFVVDTWCAPPKIRLLRRNSEELEELAELDLPEPDAGHQGMVARRTGMRQHPVACLN